MQRKEGPVQRVWGHRKPPAVRGGLRPERKDRKAGRRQEEAFWAENSTCKGPGAGVRGTTGTRRYFEQEGLGRWVMVSNETQEVSPQSAACEGLELVLGV